MKYLLSIAVFPVLIVVGWLSFNTPSNIKAPFVPTPTDHPYLSAEKLTALVNDWRVSQGLQPYIKDERLCVIAKDRIKAGDDNHAGFIAKLKSNYYQLPPGSIVSENSDWGFTTEDAALRAWLHSPGHLANLKKPYIYSCLATDKYNALQIFSSF